MYLILTIKSFTSLSRNRLKKTIFVFYKETSWNRKACDIYKWFLYATDLIDHVFYVVSFWFLEIKVTCHG